VPSPVNAFAKTNYPAAEYRVFAAFRIWTVINYFFPYKDLQGEDWDAVLRQFIPRMENAANALEYHQAVAEMVSHIHDSHGFVHSQVLREDGGSWRAPVEVRIIENVPVVTALLDEKAAKDAGIEIGDVIYELMESRPWNVWLAFQNTCRPPHLNSNCSTGLRAFWLGPRARWQT